MTHDAPDAGNQHRGEMPPLPQMPPQPQPGQPQRQYGVPQQGPSLSSQLGGTAATRPQYPEGGQQLASTPHQTAPQYGQPPLGPRPYGAQQYGPQQYGQHPAPQPEPKRKRSRAVPWLVLALPVMLVIGVVSGYLLATNYNSFDNRAVEDSVAQVLRNDYGLSDLQSVDCPNWIKVEQGQSFQCEFEYAGGTQTVTVTQGSQSGQLVVGGPE